MDKLESLLIGEMSFEEAEEFSAFRIKLLLFTMLLSLFFSVLIEIAHHAQFNDVGTLHARILLFFCAGVLTLFLLLRGHKDRYIPVAFAYGLLSLGLHVSAFIFVPKDELSVIWFVLHVAGSYVLLGSMFGVINTMVVIVLCLILNDQNMQPHSPNALITLTLSLSASSLFFWVFTKRTVSFYERMLDYNRQLVELSSLDPLTGLLNARAFHEKVKTLELLSGRQQRDFSVLFVDLDHFKSINDIHGHEAGDVVLKSVASALKHSCRQSDVVGRIGGEEFCVFLPNTALPGACELGEKLRAAIEQLMPEAGRQPLRITASVGVASSPQARLSMIEIQRQADQAMYQAKAAGRNRVTAFDAMPA